MITAAGKITGNCMVENGLKLLVVGIGALWLAAPASADSTVECRSVNYSYTECSSGSLKKPQLVHQISSSACILNRTWGYNPKKGYLWVAEGCAGVFANVAGYHYGRDDGYDSNARMYNDHGNDVGAVVGGAVVGALIEGMVGSGGQSSGKHETSNHVTNNYSSGSAGSGYSGCHGMGCLVGTSSPPEPGQNSYNSSSDAPPEPGQNSYNSSSDAPPEPDQQEMSDPQR